MRRARPFFRPETCRARPGPVPGRDRVLIDRLTLLSQRLVAQIQQASRPSCNLPRAKREIYASQINSTLANLKDDGLFARWLLLQNGRFHERMRVAAGDKINSVHLCCD